MKIRDILKDPTYQQKKILERLLCYHLCITKEELITKYEEEISVEQLKDIQAGYNAYVHDKKPLEFILGFVQFYERKFKVDTRTLIPRPETEYMIAGVDEYIKSLPSKSPATPPQILIDVGTGCGVLGLSVLLENPGFFDNAILTEYYEPTLTLAKENYEFYKKDIQLSNGSHDIQLIQANLVDFIVPSAGADAPKNELLPSQPADIILVANLPYIPDETFDTQAEDNVRKREPRPAFVGGQDGLDFYREMFAQIFTRETGLKITMFLEMMTRQVDILRKEFSDKIDFDEIKTFHFNIRIVKGVVK